MRSRLRDATRGEHDAVDALFSALDLSRPDHYGAFLRRQAAAHIPIEEALDRAGAGALLPDWPQRRRAALLQADLAELGLKPAAPVAAPVFDTAPALFGGLYVLEGSRLGGAVLRRRLSPGAPARFLSAPSADGAWNHLLALVEQGLARDSDIAVAICAARAVFRCFEQAGTRLGEPDWPTPLNPST